MTSHLSGHLFGTDEVADGPYNALTDGTVCIRSYALLRMSHRMSR